MGKTNSELTTDFGHHLLCCIDWFQAVDNFVSWENGAQVGNPSHSFSAIAVRQAHEGSSLGKW
jgi:hypothetical protein